MRAFLRRRGQTVVNFALSGLICYGAAYRAYHAGLAEDFDLVEALFFASILVAVVVILVRKEHISLDRSVFRQGLAIFNTCAALAFDTEPDPPFPWMPPVAEVVAIAGIVLGTVVLLNLGRSFGIMIAARVVKTGGAYAIVRHPMYVTYTILRTSFIMVNPSVYNLVLYVAVTAGYVYRAILEERFLCELPEYREYMEKVRYRFIPGVF